MRELTEHDEPAMEPTSNNSGWLVPISICLGFDLILIVVAWGIWG